MSAQGRDLSSRVLGVHMLCRLNAYPEVVDSGKFMEVFKAKLML